MARFRAMLRRMRLNGVRLLGERDGDFHWHVRCRQCRSGRSFYAKALAAKLGADMDIDTLKDRLKCNECGARRPWVWAMTEPMEVEQFDDLIDF